MDNKEYKKGRTNFKVFIPKNEDYKIPNLQGRLLSWGHRERYNSNS